VIEGDAAYYILKVESQGTIRVRSWEGKRLSLYSSGLGKCLLAWAEPDQQKQLINKLQFVRATPQTITSAEQLRSALTEIRSRGWSYDDGEDLEEVRCIASPVFDASGKIAAAISGVGTTFQIHEESLSEIAAKVMQAAASISKELGYIP